MTISAVSDSPITKEWRPKISNPIKKISFLPNRSERRPLNNKKTPKMSVCVLDTHESATADNLNFHLSTQNL